MHSTGQDYTGKKKINLKSAVNPYGQSVSFPEIQEQHFSIQIWHRFLSHIHQITDLYFHLSKSPI